MLFGCIMGYVGRYLQDRKGGKTMEVNSEMKDLHANEDTAPFGNEEREKNLHKDEENVPSPDSFRMT